MEIPGPTVQGIERTNEANQLFAAIDILQRGPGEPSRQDPRISWGRGQQRWNLVEREHRLGLISCGGPMKSVT